MEDTINVSDLEINVFPTRIVQTNTRLDFQLDANGAEVTGRLLSNRYNDLVIRSAYGIYDRNTHKVTIHIPYDVALKYLVQ